MWGYIHFTYIVNSEDCLLNVTDRPFPQDVILQVEVYSNNSQVWQDREKALQDMYHQLYKRNHDTDEKPRSRNTGWIRGYCETSFLINLTGTNQICKLILAELFDRDSTVHDGANVMDGVTKDDTGNTVTAGASEDSTVSGDEGMEDSTTTCNDNAAKGGTTDGRPSQESASTSAREIFYDHIFNKGNNNHEESSFYSKNYTLYDLFEFYSKCLMWRCTILW